MNTITKQERERLSRKYHQWITTPKDESTTRKYLSKNTLPEYDLLLTIPNNDWLLFCVLKYDEAPPVDSRYLFEDVKEWLRTISQPICLKPSELEWFCRVEEKDDEHDYMPRHLHFILGKKGFDRTLRNTTIKLWTAESLGVFLDKRWEHGGCLIEAYNPKQDGVGYALKRTIASMNCEDVYLSTGLKKRLLKRQE